MRAVRIGGGGPRVVDVPEPVQRGVRVRVASAGICGSDLHMVARYPLQATLGHEFAGWLDDGTPVAVEPLDPCWTCPPCRNGDYHRCVKGPATILGVGRDGGMAERCVVPASALIALPSGLPVGDACLVEPLAVAVHAVRRGRLAAADAVAVVGGGAIGLCTVAAAGHVGARVDLAARHDGQRAAGATLGAGAVADDATERYDVVIDAAGTSASLTRSVELTRSGGRVVMVATYWDGLSIPADQVSRREIDLLPAAQYHREGPSRDVDVAAAILARDPRIAAALITHRFPLDAAVEAFETAADRRAGAIKVVLEP